MFTTPHPPPASSLPPSDGDARDEVQRLRDEVDALRDSLATERTRRRETELRLVHALSASGRDAGEPFNETHEPVEAGVWEVDLATDATRWNDSVFRLLGYAPGEVAPSREAFSARVHPDDLEVIYGPAVGDRFTIEYRVVRPDGELRWMRSSNETVYDADRHPVRYRGIFVDTTAEKRAARELEKLAAVASRTQNAVIVSDAAGLIEWVNEGFTALTGYRPDEVVGRRPGEMLQGPDTSPEARALMRRAIAAGEAFEVDVLNYAKSRRQYWVHIEARPHRDAAGRLTGYIAVESDITERRISASRESLTRRVAALLLASECVEDASRRLVDELVRELDVRAAQVWLVDPASPTLVYTAGAHADPLGEAWVSISRALPFHAGNDWVVGVGAPGTAWGTGETYTRTDFWGDDVHGRPSRRSLAAKHAGIRTVCAVPVHGPRGVLAVLEIGGSHAYPGYDRIPSLLERIAEQFASFLMNVASRRAFEAVFRQSPDGLMLVDAAGVVRSINARGESMFGHAVGARLEALLTDAAALLEAARQRADADAAPFEREARRLDGSTFSAEVTVAATPGASTQAAIVSVRDLTERHRIHAALTRSLREKETLVQEVHHRVKNNLQIVSSMITLQAAAITAPDTRQALLETGNRVQSMALVHRQLYTSDDLSNVDLGGYVRAVCEMLRASLDPGAVFTFDTAAGVLVTTECAAPCGLILNELVTNAIKHGRAPDGTCHVRISLSRSETGFTLTVSDEGQGLDPARAATGSMGIRIVQALTRQLRATLSTTADRGIHVRLDVPYKAAP